MSNTGKSSEEIFEAFIQSQGGYADRLSDLIDAVKQRKVATQKPSDFIVTLKGEIHYAEVKSISEKDRFSFSGIQPSQWRAATHVTRAGGQYFFYLHFVAFNRWFKIPAKVILNSEKKSLTIREVQDYDYVIE